MGSWRTRSFNRGWRGLFKKGKGCVHCVHSDGNGLGVSSRSELIDDTCCGDDKVRKTTKGYREKENEG